MGDARRGTLRQWWLRLLLSLVLAAGFVVALFDQIDLVPADPWIPLTSMLAYLGLLVVYFGLRSGRWHFLVAPLGSVELRTTLPVSMAGIMWIMLLPLRLGELARPLFLAQKTEVRVGQALGTVAIERVVDGLIVCGLFFASLPLLPEATGDQAAAIERLRGLGLIASAGLLAVLVVLIAMALAPGSVGRLVSAILGRVLPPVADKLAGLARGIAEGLAALPSIRPLLGFLLTTLLYWGVNGVAMWVLARGCGLELPLAGAFAVMAVLGISLLVPGGPGQFGVFHYGVLLGLSMFVGEDVVHAQGSVFIFWLFVTQLSMGTVLGLIAQRTLALDWRATLTGSATLAAEEAGEVGGEGG